MSETTPERPPLTLAGFEVHHLLGAGSSGEVWLAREEAGGCLVALKRLHCPDDAAERQRLHEEATRLAGFTAEHAVSPREVLTDAEGAPVLVLDHAPGGSLAALLARRGRLSPGEVVTTAAPLAGVLADAAEQGLDHGNLRPANVLFDARGRPLLADLGLAALAGAEPTPHEDVRALAALCVQALTGGENSSQDELERVAPPPLAAALTAALDPDADARLDASEFAHALRRSCEPEPVQLRVLAAPGGEGLTAGAARVAATGLRPVSSPPAEPRRERRAAPRGSARPAPRHSAAAAPDSSRLVELVVSAAGSLTSLPVRIVLAAVAVLVAAAALGVGLAGMAGESEPTRLAVPAPPAAVSPDAVSPEGPEPDLPSVGRVSPPLTRSPGDRYRRVLDELDSRRAEAFLVPDPARLDSVYARGSPPLAADSGTLAELAETGASVTGVRHRLRDVEVVFESDTAVRLRIVDELPEHDVLDADGALLERRPGRGPQTYEVELVDAGDGWRIAGISPA